MADIGICTSSVGDVDANLDHIEGEDVDVSGGNEGLGTLRVAIATDDIPTKLTNDSLGASSAAIVVAGAAGSLSAKTRRISSDVDGIKSSVSNIENIKDTIIAEAGTATKGVMVDDR
jgi:outer membrane murein-binding lipoprotein Lpp